MAEKSAKGRSPGAAAAPDIEGMMKEIIAAAEKGDVDRTFSYLTREPGAVFFLNNRPYDLDSLIAFFRENYGKMHSQKIHVTRSQVIPLGPSSAAWISYGEGHTVTKTGISAPYSFTETWIWQKVKGTWTVTHYHETAG